ncbi:MAG: hypothetical protein IPN03_11935 [Holophagales bacterium]|nr:hypothetical protein [Holophagales bacterium]
MRSPTQRRMIPLDGLRYGLGIGRTVPPLEIEAEPRRRQDHLARPRAIRSRRLAQRNRTSGRIQLYEELKAAGVEVFWDDRDERPG